MDNCAKSGSFHGPNTPSLRFSQAAVAEIERRSSSKRTDASASLAGSASFQLPGSVKVARRPVKPRGVGASPTLAAILMQDASEGCKMKKGHSQPSTNSQLSTFCGRQADISWLHLSRKQGP